MISVYQKTMNKVNHPISFRICKDPNIKDVYVKTREFIPRKISLNWNEEKSGYEGVIKSIREGTEIKYEIHKYDKTQLVIVPVEEIDIVNGRIRIPSLANPESTDNQANDNHNYKILLETTLEGLLADYESGGHFPSSQEQLLDSSIAARILSTRIPERIKQLGYNEIMVPILASVANRVDLDPKYNYLVYNLSLDWQIGSYREVRALVQYFRSKGIEIIPDMVIAHFVTEPFDGSIDKAEYCNSKTYHHCDKSPYLFRDYKTWMPNWEDEYVRKLYIEKIVFFIKQLDLRVLRFDYLDGLALQYSQRRDNWGLVFLDELKETLDTQCKDIRIIGEAFQSLSMQSVRDFIDAKYCPRSFDLIETILNPSIDTVYKRKQAMNSVIEILNNSCNQDMNECNYIQMHDESWEDEFINSGRPSTPWAYGKFTAGLTKQFCMSRPMEHDLESDLQLYASKLSLLLTVLGLAMTSSRWMETAAVTSLSLSAIDQPNEWKFVWSNFKDKRLASLKYMFIQVRECFKYIGPILPNPPGPPLRVCWAEDESGLLIIERWGSKSNYPIYIILTLFSNKPKKRLIDSKFLYGDKSRYKCIFSTSSIHDVTQACKLERSLIWNTFKFEVWNHSYDVSIFAATERST